MFPLIDKIVAATLMLAHSETPTRRRLSVAKAPEAVLGMPFQPKTAAESQLTVCGMTFAFPFDNEVQFPMWIGLIS